MNSRLSGKTVVVTGASKGIGALLSERLAARGAKVAMLARNSAAMDKVCSRIRTGNGITLACACDITDEKQVQAAMAHVVAELEPIDILINNAAIAENVSLEDGDLDRVKAMFETNVFGTFNCVKEVIPSFISRGQGHIVNIASLVGHIGTPGYGAYSGSKGALVRMSEVWRRELAAKNICVTMVLPYYVATDLLLSGPDMISTRFPGIPLLSAEQVVNVTVRAIEKRQKEVWVPGYIRLLAIIAHSSPNLSDFLVRVFPSGRPKNWHS